MQCFPIFFLFNSSNTAALYIPSYDLLMFPLPYFRLMFLWFKYSPMFHTFTSDQQFTSYKILSSLFPMMTTIHQRNRNVSNDDDTLANPLKIYFLEYCKTNISLTSSQFHWSWVCFFFYSPYSSHPWISHCSKNVMFCLRWWLTIHQWTEYSISNSTYVQISYVKYISLLCWIWPDFIQKSSLFYQQSLGMIQTHVPIFLNSLYSLDDKIRATVSLITYTVPQNCLSLFTISQITLNTVPPLSD